MVMLETIQNEPIRHYFDTNSQKWYFSIVDVVGIITESTDARNYWKVLKSRLKKAQNKLVTECNQLKMQSSDGKFYFTDTGDKETILKIVEMISPDHIPYFEQYFTTINHKKSSNIISIKKEEYREEEIEKETYPQFQNSISENEEENEISIDGYLDKNFIIIQTFIGGVNLENLSISSSCNELIIRGKREMNENHIKEYHEQELYWGGFSRSIDLPQEIDINKIEATEHHGLITIKLSIQDKNYSRRLKIESQ